VLRARCQRQCCGSAAEKGDEVAPFHCPMRPVLPTKRIAHPIASGLSEKGEFHDCISAMTCAATD
jgi:hypothetical protein